jgi:GNAT superfamily N-acetyltransferase
MTKPLQTELTPRVEIQPLTPERWDDLVRLFGPRGACGGCWCMHWRLAHADYERRKGLANRRAMQRLVAKGAVAPGVIAYVDHEPVGWCAVAPRETFVRLARSRVLRPVDSQPVWSIVCLFVARGYRRRGVSVALLEGAAGFAADRGATIVEGYPVDARRGEVPAVFAWTGTLAAFRAAGFQEVARRSAERPIVRRRIAREATRPGRPAERRLSARPEARN